MSSYQAFGFWGVGLVRIGEAVVHEAETQFRDGVVGPGALPEGTGLHVALALSSTQKDIPPAALFNHTPGNAVMLVLVAVTCQLRPIVIPLKVSPHLVADVLEVGIVGQLVAAMIFDGPNAFDLCLNGLHDPDCINVPDNGGLPVYRR